jgi:soluble lytic murein transglycosylase-like protein
MVGISRNALERVIFNESRGNPYVGMDKSNYSAGIAQISRTVWKTYSKLPYEESANAKYYEQNITIAAQYLKMLYNRFGNWKEALQAYNVGPTALTQIKAGLRKLPKITQRYTQNFKG